MSLVVCNWDLQWGPPAFSTQKWVFTYSCSAPALHSHLCSHTFEFKACFLPQPSSSSSQSFCKNLLHGCFRYLWLPRHFTRSLYSTRKSLSLINTTIFHSYELSESQKSRSWIFTHNINPINDRLAHPQDVTKSQQTHNLRRVQLQICWLQVRFDASFWCHCK